MYYVFFLSRPLPALPPKKYFGQQFQAEVIENRCTGLQNFLIEVTKVTQYLSDSSVHLFLQVTTSLQMEFHLKAFPD